MTELFSTILPLLGIGSVGLLFVLALFRGGKGKEKDLQGQVKSLKSRIEQKDDELREANRGRAEYEALAIERKSEIVKLNSDLSKLRGRLDKEAEIKLQDSVTISRLEAEMKAQQESANEKISLLTALRQDFEAKFKELSQEALRVQGEAFAKTNIEKLELTLAPLKEHVGHFEKELKLVHQETVKDRAHLKAEIKQLSERSEEISQEAVSLTRALKGDSQKQGAWGEMILEGILERSGLRKGEEYQTQALRTNDDGDRLRPDVVVNIPGGRTLVIDSKVSLVAYSDAVNSEDEKEIASARRRHVVSIRGHINGLAAKEYQAAEDSTVDYVIMFIPIEGALSEALREDGKIAEYALEKNITIATPTTLMMALRTVKNVWAVERRNQNAEKIADRAGKLYDKVVGFIDNMETVGTRLQQANESYDIAFGQLSKGRGNLLSQIESLKTLGAKTGKKIGVDFDDHDDSQPKIETQTE